MFAEENEDEDPTDVFVPVQIIMLLISGLMTLTLYEEEHRRQQPAIFWAIGTIITKIFLRKHLLVFEDENSKRNRILRFDQYKILTQRLTLIIGIRVVLGIIPVIALTKLGFTVAKSNIALWQFEMTTFMIGVVQWLWMAFSIHFFAYIGLGRLTNERYLAVDGSKSAKKSN
jgi:hypothetical protein